MGGIAMTGMEPHAAKGDFYSMSLNSIEGKALSMGEYKGKVVLAVNIATRCGYTKQLSGLEMIYNEYKAKGLVVLGIPSNDFGAQTPEPEAEVKTFCQTRYGVTFPLTEKVQVKGAAKHDLAAKLLELSPTHDEIVWNFEKFLVDRSGKIVARYSSKVEPESKEIRAAIEKAL